MLNELYSLSATLKSKGISTKEWHREYKPLPKVTAKAPCIRIGLAKDSSICGIESISAELAQSLRKFGNNQGTFPAFNIDPLYRITDKKQLSELERIEKETATPDWDIIKSLCVNDNWKESLVKKVNRSLQNISQTLLSLIGNQEKPETLLNGFSDQFYRVPRILGMLFNSLDSDLIKEIEKEAFQEGKLKSVFSESIDNFFTLAQ